MYSKQVFVTKGVKTDGSNLLVMLSAARFTQIVKRVLQRVNSTSALPGVHIVMQGTVFMR